MGLRLLKVNFPRLGLVGLVVGVTLPNPGSLLVVRAVEMTAVSVNLFRPGLVLGVVPVGVSLSGVVGDTRPWMVLEMRAETVTSLRSGEAGRFCGFAEMVEFSEEAPELVGVRRRFVPFSDTAGGVLMEPVGVSTPFSPSAEGEEGLEVSSAEDIDAPDWRGGGGARYLTLDGSN